MQMVVPMACLLCLVSSLAWLRGIHQLQSSNCCLIFGVNMNTVIVILINLDIDNTQIKKTNQLFRSGVNGGNLNLTPTPTPVCPPLPQHTLVCIFFQLQSHAQFFLCIHTFFFFLCKADTIFFNVNIVNVYHNNNGMTQQSINVSYHGQPMIEHQFLHQ